MSSKTKCYNDEVPTSYCSFTSKPSEGIKLLKSDNGIYYVNNTDFTSLLLIKSVDTLYEQRYLLDQQSHNFDYVQNLWIQDWNNNFAYLSNNSCISCWDTCYCSFHRHKRWIKTKDDSLSHNSTELLFWKDYKFHFNKDNLEKEISLPYFLDKESFLFLYSKINKPLEVLNKKENSFLNRRLSNLIRSVKESNISEQSLVFSTLKLKKFYSFNKVKKIISDYLSSPPETFFIFPELDKCNVPCHLNAKKNHHKKFCSCEKQHDCIRIWHLHILHKSEINIVNDWKLSNNVHQTQIIGQYELESTLSYLTKDWVSYMFLSLKKYGFNKANKFFIEINNNKKKIPLDRKEYFDNYFTNDNYSRKLLINQKSKLLKKININPEHKKINVWKEKLLEVNSNLNNKRTTVTSTFNIYNILEKNPIKRKLSLYISLKENLLKEKENKQKELKINKESFNDQNIKIFDSS